MAGHKVGQALPAKASSRVKAMRALSTSSRASESTQSYFRIHDDNTWLDPSGTSIVSAEEALNLDRCSTLRGIALCPGSHPPFSRPQAKAAALLSLARKQ